MYLTDIYTNDCIDCNSERIRQLSYYNTYSNIAYLSALPVLMNLIQHCYRDNRDNVLHYRDIGILIITQPYETNYQTALLPVLS